MGKENVNIDEILQELIDYAEIGKELSAADGWFTIQDMQKFTGETKYHITTRLNKKIEDGLIKRERHGKKYYYRIISP
jgi:hypothetical protein